MGRLIDRLPDELEEAAQAFLRKACERSLTIATAESCTGGLIASLLTDVEGSSHAFERGFVVYSDDAKTEMLGIDPQVLNEQGAVSKAVALAMAKGELVHSTAHIDLAVTGFAGPAGPDDEPGLVHFACTRRGRGPVHREEHFGDIGRTSVRVEAVRVALQMMTDALT
mgnify:FL=1